MRRLLLCLTPLLSLLAACGDTYRYPCQNPAKANTTECQCTAGPRTKNKALGVIDTAPTTTLGIVGFDC